MSVTFKGVTKSLVKILLHFRSDDVDQQSDYLIVNSPSDAGFEQCLKDQIDDVYMQKNIEWYDKRTDSLNLYKKEKKAVSIEQESNTLLSDQDNCSSPNAIKGDVYEYLEIRLPIARCIYEKIIKIIDMSLSSLQVDEIYDIITSNLVNVLDNRLYIVHTIVNILQNTPDMLELLSFHHYNQIYFQLSKLKDVVPDRDMVLSMYNSPTFPQEIFGLLDRLDKQQNKNLVLRTRFIVLHWDNSLRSFMLEAQKYLCTTLVDSKGINILSLGENHGLGFNLPAIKLEMLNIGYLANYMRINYCSLLQNMLLLEEKFNVGNGCSNIALDIDFTNLVSDDSIMDASYAMNIFHEVLSCGFVCGDHVSKLFLRFKGINFESTADFTLNKQCELFFDDCSLVFIQSLAVKCALLNITNMISSESLIFDTNTTKLVCNNITMANKNSIVIQEGCEKVKLTNIFGQVKFTDGLTVSCAKNSEVCRFTCPSDRISDVKLANVLLKSTTNTSINYKSLMLMHVNTINSNTMRFIGTSEQITIKSCKGSFNFDRITNVKKLNLLGTLSENINIVLPPNINELAMKDVTIDNKSFVVNSQLDSLTIHGIKTDIEAVVDIQKTCSKIKITELDGRVKLFDMVEITGEKRLVIYSPTFSLEKIASEYLYHLQANSISLRMRPEFCSLLKKISLTKVIFVEPVMVDTSQDTTDISITKFQGKINLSGVVQGTLTVGIIQSGNLMIKQHPHGNNYDINIECISLSENVTIRGNVNTLNLCDIDVAATRCLDIYGNYETILVTDCSGRITINTHYLDLNRPQLKKASFEYTKSLSKFRINGEYRTDDFCVPQRIKHLFLRGVIINESKKIYLHENLEKISIIDSEGDFHLANLFNIKLLTLKRADVVKMDITSDQRLQVELKNLDLEQSFTATKNTKKVVLDHVTMKNNSVVIINPSCQLIIIRKTTCLISFLSLEGQKNEFMSWDDNCYEFTKQCNSDNWAFLFKNSCLSKEDRVSNNFRSVTLYGIQDIDHFPITVNENCQHLQIDHCSVTVICSSLSKLDTFSVSICVHNMMEVHFQEMRPITFEIRYLFDSEESICIILNSIHLQKFVFRQNRFYSGKVDSQNLDMNNLFELQPTEFDINPQDVSTSCEAGIVDVMIMLEEHFKANASDCKRLAAQIIERIDIRFIAYN